MSKLNIYVTIATFAFLLVVVAITDHPKTEAETSCSKTCTYTIEEGGFTYDVDYKASGHGNWYCNGSGLFNCNLAKATVLKKISLEKKFSDKGGASCDDCHDCPTCPCGNENHISYNWTANIRSGSISGCSGGQYYCEVFRQCVPSGEQCNEANPNYIPWNEDMNKNIPARIGPVSFKSPTALVVIPPIGNPGYTCRIAWNNAFASYDTTTLCTFTGPGVNMSFEPASTSSPTFYDAGNIKNDTSFKMTCKDGDMGTPKSTTAICRLNWNYKEVN